jgi:hypothetical protein
MTDATMPSAPPGPATFGVGDGGESVAYVGDSRAVSLAELLGLAPHLVTSANATELARAANHFASGADFVVITDPGAFAEAYRRRLATEDPNADWQENVIRLCDFGVPDFEQIKPPALEDGRLTYFVSDTFLGVPYKAMLEGFDQKPDYVPLSLTPIERHFQSAEMQEGAPETDPFTEW